VFFNEQNFFISLTLHSTLIPLQLHGLDFKFDGRLMTQGGSGNGVVVHIELCLLFIICIVAIRNKQRSRVGGMYLIRTRARLSID
jgi:hypothetical protein